MIDTNRIEDDMRQILDSHVHLDMIQKHHPKRIEWLKENHCGVVSWSYFNPPDSVAQLKHDFQTKARVIQALAASGLHCHYLAGIHPRSMPPDLKPEAVESLLANYMDDPRCLGVGEIGLEAGNTREKEIFIAQMEMGRWAIGQGKVIGIHTPRSHKIAMAERTLEMLAQFSDIAASIVVDHCTLETIRMVIDAGFWAGVTLSPEKVSLEEMIRIVSLCSGDLDHIMCNSDSGYQFYEDFVQHSRCNEISEDMRRKLFRDNALTFFRHS